MNEDNIELEVTLEALEAQRENRNRLHRLMKNDDFVKLILDGYIKDEAVRTTKLLGDPSVRSNVRAFDSCIDELKAIGLLDNHLTMVEAIGNQADADLKAYAASEHLLDDEDDTDDE